MTRVAVQGDWTSNSCCFCVFHLKQEIELDPISKLLNNQGIDLDIGMHELNVK